MPELPKQSEVIIIGGGAAGLMCAITAAKRGRQAVILDHANKVGKKILMSGGGRCNFTNYEIEPARYLSQNPHYCKSALSRYTQWDFIGMVGEHQIPYHEKTLGQLFCDNKSSDILNMLLDECDRAGVQIHTQCSVETIESISEEGLRYKLDTSMGSIRCESLVVATGGLSIPTMGATGFGYQIAEQFGLSLLPTSAGLVPFTLEKSLVQKLIPLAGNSAEVIVSCNDMAFKENILFTHRGLSGPAILQISSYWKPGDSIQINWLPNSDAKDWLITAKTERPKTKLRTLLGEAMTKNWAKVFCEHWLNSKPLNQYSDKELEAIANRLEQWEINPAGTEGYRTAEVTLGGVSTDELSSKTMEAKKQTGLYFIGEVVDVTGWLGGYNFQWAWASGYAAGGVV